MISPSWMLACPACGKRFRLDPSRTSCCTDRPLELRPPEERIPEVLPPLSRGIRRYAPLLPFPAGYSPVDLGERVTPLVELPWGSGSIIFKTEGLLPTGSFKDRGYHVLVNRMAAWGIPEAVGDSSGNAAASLAAYCARTGIRAVLHVPESASPAKLDLIRRFGAEVRPAPTRSEARNRAVREGARTFYAGHTGNPFFLHGVKTLAYELRDQLGGRMPGTVVAPVGNGTLILGLWLGFREMIGHPRRGRPPRLVGVQARNCAPLAAAFELRSADPVPVRPAPTAAEGIAIPEPPRGREILEAVRDSGGVLVAVGEAEITAAHRDLARRGYLVEPTSAAAAAALPILAPGGATGRPTVVILTGSGLKTVQP